MTAPGIALAAGATSVRGPGQNVCPSSPSNCRSLLCPWGVLLLLLLVSSVVVGVGWEGRESDEGKKNIIDQAKRCVRERSMSVMMLIHSQYTNRVY